jgi:hypothetical protein
VKRSEIAVFVASAAIGAVLGVYVNSKEKSK